MLTMLRRHRALTPSIVAAALAVTTLAATPAASAVINADPQLASGAIGSAGTADASDEPAADAAYRVRRGIALKAKPPPWVLPVAGYHLTGHFGQSSGLWASTHTGLDFAAPEGASLKAIGPGVVTQTGYDGAYGDKTVIRLDDGTVLWYCHQSEIDVTPGQRVRQGDPIGKVGSTGNVTGPHLHLEVHPRGGGPIDPESWLPTHHLHP